MERKTIEFILSVLNEKRSATKEGDAISKIDIVAYLVSWVIWVLLTGLYTYGLHHNLLLTFVFVFLPPVCVWLLCFVFHLPLKKAVGYFAFIIIILVVLFYFILRFYGAGAWWAR